MNCQNIIYIYAKGVVNASQGKMQTHQALKSFLVGLKVIGGCFEVCDSALGSVSVPRVLRGKIQGKVKGKTF